MQVQVTPGFRSCLCVSDVMVGMGYSREEINDSLAKMKYDDITATYLLLGRKAAEVRGYHGNSRCEHHLG